MGLLSKKLGGATGLSPKVQTLPESNAVAYKWSNQSYTMAQLMEKFKLPCVVQCATESCTVVWSDFQFDLRQPLLLRSRRTAQKVHARSIKRKSKEDGNLEEFGPPLAIPEDYDGWFAASPKGENQVTRHFRVEGVAKSTARRFLATTKLPAFTSSKTSEGSYIPHNVMPGEVLTRVCLMGDDPDDPDPTDIVQEHGPCLECLDEKEEPVILPLSMRGILYEVADQYPDQPGRVFQISSVVEAGNSRLPRILTLVHGDPPVLAFTFTGMLRCYSIFTEETILAGTLDEPDSMCLELATDSAAKFRLGLNESAIKLTCEYMNAYSICETFGPKFISGIKVSFSLNPEPSALEDIDMSFYQNASDAQEVDANSEFEFAWGSVKKAKLSAAFTSGKPVNPSDETQGEGASKVTSFPMGIPHQLLSDRLSGESEDSVPGHREFTEEEIKELIRLKGIDVENTDPSGHETPYDLDALKENRVRDNPLYYYFQKNPKTASEGEEDTEISESEISTLEKNVVVTNSKSDRDLTHVDLERREVKGNRSLVRDGRVVDVLVDVHAQNDDNDFDLEEIHNMDSVTYRSARDFDPGDLSDSSEGSNELNNDELAKNVLASEGLLVDDSFRDVTCTPASEYHDDLDDLSEESNEDEDDDDDDDDDDDVDNDNVNSDSTGDTGLDDIHHSPEETLIINDLTYLPLSSRDLNAKLAQPSTLPGEITSHSSNNSDITKTVELKAEPQTKSNVYQNVSVIPAGTQNSNSAYSNLSTIVAAPHPFSDIAPTNGISAFPPPPPVNSELQIVSETPSSFSENLSLASKTIASPSLVNNTTPTLTTAPLSNSKIPSPVTKTPPPVSKTPPSISKTPPRSERSSSSSLDTVTRLNTLIDEVTALVDTSTDRIKESTSASNSVSSSPMVTRSQPDHEDAQSPTLSNDSYDGDTFDLMTNESSPTLDDNYDKIDAAVSSIAHSKLDIEKEGEKEEEETPKKKLSPWHKKKKIQSAIHFFTTLGDGKSKTKSEESSGVSKRSNKPKHSLFSHSSSEKHSESNTSSGPGWLSKVRSQERLNKVLSQDNTKANRFGSPKITQYPHDHPHKSPQNEPHINSKTDLAQTPDQENCRPDRPSPKRPKGKILSSVYNTEVATSSLTSLSTDYSSSATSINSVVENKPSRNKQTENKDSTLVQQPADIVSSVDASVALSSLERKINGNQAEMHNNEDEGNADKNDEGVTIDNSVHGVSDNGTDDDDSEVETVVEEHFFVGKNGRIQTKKSPRSAMVFNDSGINGLTEDYV